MTQYRIRPILLADYDAIVALDRSENPYPWGEKLILQTLAQQSLTGEGANEKPVSEKKASEKQQRRCHWLVEEVHLVENTDSVEGTHSMENTSRGVCGFLLSSLLFDETEIELLVVAAENRQQGLAKSLIDTWLKYGRQHGVSSAILEVRESNTRAIHLYQVAGFSQVGIRKNYYPVKHSEKSVGQETRESAMLMAKTRLAE